MSEPNQDKKSQRSGFRGRPILCALALFVGINVALGAAKPNLQIKATDLPARQTWEWWRTKSYLEESKTPDMVLMGSSLMMIPTSLVEADCLNQNVDVVSHPRSVYIENQLKDAGAKNNFSCFNFSLPGAMISDQYFTQHSLFTGDKTPKVLVLGLTLRDFIDSGVDSATSTPTYQFFRHFGKPDEVKNLLTVSPQAAAEEFYNNVNYLSDKRLELQTYFSKPLNNAGSKALANFPVNTKFDANEPQEKSDGNILGGAAVTKGAFVMPPHKVIAWKDNTREYKKRFASANEKLFVNQLAFFDQLIADAKAKGIKVVVANMPLTEMNMSLMPNGMYERYMSEMGTRSQLGQFSFVDLNTQWVFKNSDFQDTAHLNDSGGEKFMDLLAKSLILNGPVRKALTMAGFGADSQQATTDQSKVF